MWWLAKTSHPTGIWMASAGWSAGPSPKRPPYRRVNLQNPFPSERVLMGHFFELPCQCNSVWNPIKTIASAIVQHVKNTRRRIKPKPYTLGKLRYAGNCSATNPAQLTKKGGMRVRRQGQFYSAVRSRRYLAKPPLAHVQRMTEKVRDVGIPPLIYAAACTNGQSCL